MRHKNQALKSLIKKKNRKIQILYARKKYVQQNFPRAKFMRNPKKVLRKEWFISKHNFPDGEMFDKSWKRMKNMTQKGLKMATKKN